MSVEPPMVVLRHRVCSTRGMARELIASRPDVSPGLAVYLRCDTANLGAGVSKLPKPMRDRMTPEMRQAMKDARGVEIMTPSFADEILKAWPKAQLVGASEDVQVSWELASERRPSTEGGSRSNG